MSAPTLDTPQNWSAAADAYSERVAPRLTQPFADALAECLAPDPAARMLEVGAGSGALTQVLASRAGSLLAIDFAPRMIEILKERMAGAAHVTCEVMDGQSLPLEDDSFDCAAAAFALMLFADRAAGFSELNRVVKPGGRVMVANWSGQRDCGAMSFLDGIIRRTFPWMPQPRLPPLFSLADPAVFRAEMEAAGFRDVTLLKITREMIFENADAAFGMVSSAAPAALAMMSSLGQVERDNLRAEIERVFAQDHRGGPVRLENAARVAVGTAT